MRRGRSMVSFAIFALASSTLLAGGPDAVGVEPPSARLFAASSRVDVERNRHGFARVDPGLWVASVGGALELHVSRPDYDTPVSIVQIDATTGAALRMLPADLLEGWLGLRDFLHVRVTDASGRVVLRQSFTFCPNSWYRARLSDDGPLTSVYPYFCGGNPFTRGTVWGIDDSWAVSALVDYPLGFRAPRDHYRLRAWVDPAWVDALRVAPEGAEAVVSLTVHDRRSGHRAPMEGSESPFAPGPRVSIVSTPDPNALPDVVALPAWGFSTSHRKGRDLLTFNATEWNAGPGTLVVEGFRGPDQERMDAFQYFLDGDVPTGRAPIGQMEYHRRHQHWHFRQFTEYSMLDAESGLVQTSGKQSWCLANTDAIDLAVRNANWAAFGGDLFTMCGGPGALWIREVLDVGWGDTYSQFVAGQAFDITDVPNGEYLVRVQVNPTGSLLEGSIDNNVEDRLVKLRGGPGNRRVIVPPWHGIDTEAGCYYCI